MNNSLGDRMKEYEYNTRNFLIKRVPVIIRLDGKAFHTFTRGMEKPFDTMLQSVMQSTMKELCEQIQGAIFGYTQSDEITIVLYAPDPQSEIWFNSNIQKMVSVSASIATLTFNKLFKLFDVDKKYEKKYDTALFDSRVFNIPFDEVNNCLIWRQQDATKNSISAAAQFYFSHKSLQGLTGKEKQEKLWTEANINWNDYMTVFKRGAACKKVEKEITTENGTTTRMKWEIDLEMPILTEDRKYAGF